MTPVHAPLEDLLRLAPCGLVSLGEQGRLLAINDALLGMLGRAREELVGQPLSVLLPLASRLFCETHVFPLLRLHGRVEEIALTLRTRSGESMPVLLNAVRQERDGGAVYHCSVMSVRERGRYEDELLQARRQAEEALRGNAALSEVRRELEERARQLDDRLSELEQRNAQLTRVSTLLAQDLREPTRKLSLFSCLFTREDREGLSLTGQHSLERIKTVSARLEQLVTGLHQFMALDVLDEPLEEVDLIEAVADARRRLRELGGAPAATLRCAPLPVIEGRHRQLMTLFFHLMDNAAKFHKPGQTPHIDIECQLVQHNRFRALKDKYHYADFAQITVADQGIGFDNRDGDLVFEVLHKLDPDSPGLGVGLPICRQVVHNHHGSISVESEPGQGTRFTLLLPVRQQPARPPTSPP